MHPTRYKVSLTVKLQGNTYVRGDVHFESPVVHTAIALEEDHELWVRDKERRPISNTWPIHGRTIRPIGISMKFRLLMLQMNEGRRPTRRNTSHCQSNAYAFHRLGMEKQITLFAVVQ